MAPAAGWYSDPNGSGEVRFWDGQKWTAATSAIPQARQRPPTAHPQHAVAGALSEARAGTGTAAVESGVPNRSSHSFGGYSATVGVATPISASPPKPGVGQRWKIVVAAAAAIGVAAAVAAPTVFSSPGPALSSAFQHVLLTPSTVSALAGQPYTITSLKAEGSNGNSSTQCSLVANAAGTGSKDKADAARGFASADNAPFIIEALSNNPAYPQAMDQIQSAMKSCSENSFDGSASVSVTPLVMPQIAGSDGTVGVEMAGQVSGTTLVMDMAVARYGDNIVAVMVGGVNPSQPLQTLMDSVLTQAALTARPEFSRA